LGDALGSKQGFAGAGNPFDVADAEAYASLDDAALLVTVFAPLIAPHDPLASGVLTSISRSAG